MFIFERDSMSEGGAERERERARALDRGFKVGSVLTIEN